MILNAYCVRDQKMGAYMAPFFVVNDAVAIRSFCEAARDPNSNICRWPSDFALFAVGSFDDSFGALVPFAAPVSLGLASDLLAVLQVPPSPLLANHLMKVPPSLEVAK